MLVWSVVQLASAAFITPRGIQPAEEPNAAPTDSRAHAYAHAQPGGHVCGPAGPVAAASSPPTAASSCQTKTSSAPKA